MQALTHAARQGYSLAVRYACLAKAGDLSACKTQASVLRVPAACSELATVLVREEAALAATPASDAAATVALLERCDAFRKPKRFSELLQVAACRDVALSATHLQKSLEWAQAVATNLVASDANSAGASGPEVGQMIRQARVNAVAAGLALGML
jgi:tRNA nucleotidyltransferase (CCA-adding enzyme)